MAKVVCSRNWQSAERIPAKIILHLSYVLKRGHKIEVRANNAMFAYNFIRMRERFDYQLLIVNVVRKRCNHGLVFPISEAWNLNILG